MGDDRQRENFLTAIRKACRIAKKLRELGVRPVWRGPDRLGRVAGGLGQGPDRKPEEDRRDIQARPRRSLAITANAWPPRERFAGAACTRGGRWSTCCERVGEPETVGFQADMSHTLLYTLGENAPEDRILPKDYDWKDRAVLDEALKKLTAALRPWTNRFPRRAERRDGLRLGHTRPHRPPLPGDRPQRQARYPPSRRLLAPRREWQAHQENPPHLLGRLHVSQRRHDRPQDLDRHPVGHDRRARCAWVERVRTCCG